MSEDNFESHEKVPHPKSLISSETKRFRWTEKASQQNNKLLSWLTSHILESVIMFDLALVIPILVLIPSLQGLRDIVIILSSNWIQLWALFALQRSQGQADIIRQAKADADHQALTHIALEIDELVRHNVPKERWPHKY